MADYDIPVKAPSSLTPIIENIDSNLEEISLDDNELFVKLNEELLIESPPAVALTYYSSPTFYKELNYKTLEHYKLNTKYNKIQVPLFLFVSIILYILDLLSDFIVGIQYALQGDYFKCIIIYFFFYVSSLTTTCVSSLWYSRYLKSNYALYSSSKYGFTKKTSNQPKIFSHAHFISHDNRFISWTYRAGLFILNAAPLGSYFYVLSEIIKSSYLEKETYSKKICYAKSFEIIKDTHYYIINKEEKNNKPNLKENMYSTKTGNNLHNTDNEDFKHIAIIKYHADYERLFQCFIESVPQIVLQSTFLTSDMFDKEDIAHQIPFRIASIGLSIINIAITLYAYNKYISTRTFKKNGLHYDKTNDLLFWMKYLWHFIITIARIAIYFTIFSFCVFLKVDYNEIIWPFAIPTALILFQWSFLSCVIKIDGWNTIFIHFAQSWMFVWFAISTNQPKSNKFYLLYYISQFVTIVIFLIFCLIQYNVLDIFGYQITCLFVIMSCISLLILSLGLSFKIIYYYVFKP